MLCVFLIRHGEVEGNQAGRPAYVGWGDKPLTARGEAQAAAVARRLAGERLAAVYASDLQRARCTGERIAALHGLSVQCDPALREINFGAWEGLTEAELRADWGEWWERRLADPVNVAPPEGESLADLWARWEPAWRGIVERHSASHDEGQAVSLPAVAVVGHNSALRVLLCHLLGMPPANFRRIHVSNAGLTRVEIRHPEGAAPPLLPPLLVRAINDTSHLEGI